MPKLTHEQVEKYNKGNENDFFFNVRRFLERNEKEISKDIKLDEKKTLRVDLMYTEDYIKVTNEYGCTYNKPTFKKVPTIWFTVWNDAGNGMMSSHGLGYHASMGEAVERQSYKILQGFTKQLTTATCLQLFEDLKKRQSNKLS